MRLLMFMIFSSIVCVLCKNNVKSLTESMGQEVIEIGAPIKELPPGLEEEPSAENEDDDKLTSTTLLPATKKEMKKTTTITIMQKHGKNVYKTDGNSQEDDEARIEKELAEIYRDNSDYKADSAEVTKETSTTEITEDEKPIARQRASFKFQPDSNNKAEIERFRTSIDEISCDKRVTRKLYVEQTPENSAPKFTVDAINVILFYNMLLKLY